MADAKLTALADLPSAPSDADVIYIVRGATSYKTTYGALKTAIADFAQYVEVANFAALPSAASNSGAIYVCLASQGTYFVNRKPAGLYYSDGATWAHLADATEAYFQDTLAWTNITSKPSTFAPSAHAASHATAGGDPLTLSQSQITSLVSDLAGKAASSHTHAAADITSGVLAIARLATGTPDGTKFVRDDGTLAVPAGGGSGTKSLGILHPMFNEPPASAFATLDTRNSRTRLDFDDTANESILFSGVIREGANLASGIKVRIVWMATTATSGNVRWRCEWERGTTDSDSDSFDTATEANGAANGTSGIATVTEITCTTIDSLAVGDPYMLRITRVATDTGNDTITGDVEYVIGEIQQVA